MNITNNMTTEDIIMASHNFSAVPAIIIAYAFIFFVILIIGMLVFDTSNGRKKFFISWLVGGLVCGLFLIFLIYSPFAVQSITEFFTKLWN